MVTFLASFLSAALSATGVGGGGLLVLYLRLVCKTEQLTAQGLNLAFFAVSSVCAGIVHLFRRKLSVSLILYVGIIGFFGSVFGLFAVSHINPALLQKAFGIFIIFCGGKTLFASRKKEKEKAECSRKIDI